MAAGVAMATALIAGSARMAPARLELDLGIGLCHALPGLGVGLQNTGQGPELRKLRTRFLPQYPAPITATFTWSAFMITSPVCIGFPAFIINARPANSIPLITLHLTAFEPIWTPGPREPSIAVL